jgi:hypothetical protein
MKVQRALNSLVKNLGGWKPYNDTDQQEETTAEDETSAADSEEE